MYFIIIMASGWSTLKNTISSSHGSADIHLLNKLQKYETQLAKKRCHIIFLTECRKLQVIPNGLRLQFPYKEDKKIGNILRKTEYKLLKEVIRIMFIQINNGIKQKEELLSSFTTKYPDHLQDLNILLANLHDVIRHETKLKHQKKMENLMINEECTCSKSPQLKVVKNTIVNLAEDIFTPSENENTLLSLGLNYAIPMHLELDGVIDFLSATEMAISKAKLKDDDANMFRSEIIKILERNKTPTFKINRIQWITRTIKTLKQNKNIVILSADKGNSTVIMKKEEYEMKVYDHLNSPDYSNATHDPIDSTKKALSIIVENNSKRLYNRHITNQNEQFDPEDQKKWIRDGIKKWIPYEPVTPIFYGLPKLHKENIPLRPIVDFRGSITYRSAKHLNDLLKQYTKSWKYSTTNSNTFLEAIKQVSIPRGYKMVSFDVKSLFTKVPVEFTIQYLEKRLLLDNHWKKDTYFNLDEIIELVKICSSNTYFRFRDHLFKQDSGLPMGSPLSPILAEFCMQSLEESIVDGHPFIKFWVRYVDDVYAIVKSRKLHDILTELNGYHTSIQFTVEEEHDFDVWGIQKSGLPFLDILIYRQDDNSLGHCVYRKPTHTNRYLHYTSSHPKAHKVSVVDSQVTRALFLCDQNTLQHELGFVTSILQENGYPLTFIKRRIQLQKNKQFLKIPIQTNTNPNMTDEYEKRAVLPYYEGITEDIASFIRRNTELEIAYVPQNKVSHHLNKHKDKKRNIPAGIYKIPCDGNKDNICAAAYIGETRQGLEKRAQQHTYHIRNANIQESAPAEHIWTTGHNMDPSKIQMVEVENNTFRRKIKEGLYIRSNTSSINKNKGFVPNPSWTHILHKKFRRHQEKITRNSRQPP